MRALSWDAPSAAVGRCWATDIRQRVPQPFGDEQREVRASSGASEEREHRAGIRTGIGPPLTLKGAPSTGPHPAGSYVLGTASLCTLPGLCPV